MLTALFGSGAALLVVGIAWIISNFADAAPGKGDEIAFVIALVLMLLGGVEMVGVGAGQYVMDAMHWAIGWGGSVLLVVVSLIALFLIGKWVKAVLTRKERGKLVWLAFLLPFFLAVPTTGVLHQLFAALQQPASSVTVALGAKFGVV